jgi:methylmalonyl-CoA mutase
MRSLADWRALVEQDGVTLDKLVQQTAEGVAIEPLYVDGPAPAMRPGQGTVGVCMRVRNAAEALEALDGGADALWIDASDREAHRLAAARGAQLVVEQLDRPRTAEQQQAFDADDADDSADPPSTTTAWLGFDPLAMGLQLDRQILSERFASLTLTAPTDDLGTDLVRCVRVNALQFHAAGADAADELALALSTTVAYLRALFEGGLDHERAARQLWFQIAVGRDTFGEICKLRALRLLAGKVYAAAGLTSPPPPIHAVSSPRTQAQRDPWVNMLRVTTEVFAVILGGAELVSPAAFDDALGVPSELGRRVARNTALVLRDESHLGRVIDAAGGSYYIESRTDALAREAWRRFQQIERDGGVLQLAASGALHERLATAWRARGAAIAKRKEPVLGVSEYANLGETLPSAIPAQPTGASQAPPVHRDAEGFEALRDRTARRSYDVMLVQLGTPAESRARVGFAKGLFATAGVAAREVTVADALAGVPEVACLCGSDDNYAAHAVAVAAELRASGVVKIALAGRPRALEAALREAGVDAFVYVGCDVLATLGDLFV